MVRQSTLTTDACTSVYICACGYENYSVWLDARVTNESHSRYLSASLRLGVYVYIYMCVCVRVDGKRLRGRGLGNL